MTSNTTTPLETVSKSAKSSMPSVDPKSPLVKQLMGDAQSVAQLIEGYGRMSLWIVAQSQDNLQREFNALELKSHEHMRTTTDSMTKAKREFASSVPGELIERVKELEQGSVELKRKLEIERNGRTEDVTKIRGLETKVEKMSKWLKETFPDKFSQ